MNLGTVCSGIGAPEVAAQSLGWYCRWAFEIEPFPSTVLAARHPGVTNYGDLTKHDEHNLEPVDVLIGGTPCQDFSVAGFRAGLAGERGGLVFDYFRLVDRIRPRWCVWENVPGVLSSNGGRDFGSILGALAELGYGWAYRILDAKHFGVPQRRRRVFVIGHLGDWRRAAAVLFERESVRGDFAARGETGQDVAGTPGSRATSGGGFGGDFECANGVIASTGETSHCLNAGGMGRQDYETETLIAPTLDASYGDKWGLDNQHIAGALAAEPGMKQQTYIAFSSKDYGADASVDISPTLRAAGHDGSHANAGCPPAVAFHGSQDPDVSGSVTHPVGRNGGRETSVLVGSCVRRLTPRECERLQGLPDDYTLVTYRKKPAPDGPRYKAIGNSMAVPCVRWIFGRMAAVEAVA